MVRPLLLVALLAGPAVAQPPERFPPDAETLKRIEAKRAELRKAIDALVPEAGGETEPDLEVYAKAAEWTVRHGEWLTEHSVGQTLAVLDAGLARAKAAAGGKAPWREVRGRPVVLGYRSDIDGSIQPYRLTVPLKDAEDEAPIRLDVVLHGRDARLTEVKFLAEAETAKPGDGPPPGVVVIEPYGRGNNGYRWAGERDVLDVEGLGWTHSLCEYGHAQHREYSKVIRGFSMGGAGAWHLGLHHPSEYAAMAPGAGFVTTRGYLKGLPDPLPDYQARGLRIYDALDYAGNAANIPVVAYSGEKDPQKAAADAVAAAVKGLTPPARFMHLVAPGLEHEMPPAWKAKVDAEIARAVSAKKSPRWERYHFETCTAKYGGLIDRLDRHYDKATVDMTLTADSLVVKTVNVRSFSPDGPDDRSRQLVVDGQEVHRPPGGGFLDMADRSTYYDWRCVKTAGRWAIPGRVRSDAPRPLEKIPRLQGPIDDAFGSTFAVVRPEGAGWSVATDRYAVAAVDRLGSEWDKYFRGRLPTRTVSQVKADAVAIQAARKQHDLSPFMNWYLGMGETHWVLFGDPRSNPVIADMLPKLPITWTPEKLVVNGVTYDPRTHVPALIYPNPLDPGRYVVINSGHTFHAKEFEGSAAELYPRLGDWAVLKVTPTEKDPAAAEVVAAGLFDEFWQFPKK